MAKIKIQPLGDRVLVKAISAELKGGKTKSGFIIPDTVSKDRPEEGLVVTVGPGRLLDNGQIVPVAVKKGQRIVFTKYGPEEIKIDDEDYLIISESNILAIIED